MKRYADKAYLSFAFIYSKFGCQIGKGQIATSFGPVCDQDSVMKFGLDQLRTGLRPGSSRFELSRHVEIARTEAKFHYAIWSQTGPKLVADLLARASSLLAR